MSPKRNSGRLLLKLGLALVVLAGIGVALFYSLRSTARVAVVKRALAEDLVPGSVTIDADGGIRELKSEAAGKVIDVEGIKPGRKFKKGDPLVKLDDRDLVRAKDEAARKYEAARKAAGIQAKSNTAIEDAERALETAKRLQALNEVTAESVRAADRTLNLAKTAESLRELKVETDAAEFEFAQKELQLQIEKMTVEAPIDGEIHESIVWRGALIGAGTPVALFFSNERVVAARISEEDFGRVKVGQPARLRLLTYGGETFDATVKETFPVADAAQRFKVFLDVKVDPERLKPNSTGEVTITVDRHDNALTIPRRALINGNQVFVVRDGVVERRDVEVGFRALNAAEIRKGLEEGEQVIVENLEMFRAGKRVRVEVVGN